MGTVVGTVLLLLMFALVAVLIISALWRAATRTPYERARSREERQSVQASKQRATESASLVDPKKGVKCPACSSTAVRHVGLAERAVGGVAGGLLFSKSARAQFRCTNCDYFF